MVSDTIHFAKCTALEKPCTENFPISIRCRSTSWLLPELADGDAQKVCTVCGVTSEMQFVRNARV